MNNKIKSLSIFVIATLFFVSCNKEMTIQEYYVKKQENSNFLAIDIPASLFKVQESASEETKSTMASIKKLNVLAFKINDENAAQYATEYEEVKKIIKGSKYNELMRMKHDNMNIVINYQGEDDAIDEFVLFAADNNKGFAIARVLGNKMDPAKIMKMAKDMENIDKEGAGDALGQLSELFGDI
ncbi:DUF4252 domain-containing protein [Lutimonas zeaxanthinifaciens]|uniref:DUF4252 domain-containing protein n=1 Tax=Lutimonas zeaxanthinifaciens TaxID=3060215 RepID=UPI00265CDBF6|nr:DUF4252 domain-containing protein [Lutimonas sp. YSD2104]WKK64560.1 DUF4252 domain-containing protein [Lutimonas sp. YSD2104]